MASTIVKEVVKDEKTVAELSAIQEQLADKESVISEKEHELAKLKKQLEKAGDQALIKFEVKFEEFQSLIQELLTYLNALGEEKQERCRQAIKAVIGGLAI